MVGQEGFNSTDQKGGSTYVQGLETLRLLNLEDNCLESWDEVMKLSQLQRFLLRSDCFSFFLNVELHNNTLEVAYYILHNRELLFTSSVIRSVSGSLIG